MIESVAAVIGRWWLLIVVLPFYTRAWAVPGVADETEAFLWVVLCSRCMLRVDGCHILPQSRRQMGVEGKVR